MKNTNTCDIEKNSNTKMLSLESLQILIVVLSTWLMAVKSTVVITAQGKIRGVAHEGHMSYEGIPYASVMDKHGRFKTAGIAPFWQGIKEPPKSTCRITSEVEDCLRLDVHVASTSSSTPVLVWVTGGSGQFDPGKLVQQGIIVVIVHHRQGPLGFVCLREESAPGNAGVKDVVLALRWVRDNIVAFKGNPAKVTVGGQGFAAAMVEALMLTPMAQGLYHGIILQSGTILSPLAFNYDAEERAEELAEMFRTGSNATRVLLNTNVGDLVVKSERLNRSYYPFGLCVEKELKNEEQIITESPFELLSKKKVNSVPMIIGYNNDEAYIFAYNLKHARVLKRMSRDMAFLLPEELKFFNKREVEQALREIRDLYFDDKVSMATVLEYFRDAYFVNHIHRSARLHALASNQPVYYYQFTHSGFVGVAPESGLPKTGAAHSDELAYLFPKNSKEFTNEDGSVQQNVIKLWTNLVKYLNPTPRQGGQTTWEPLNPHDPQLLSIGAQVEMKPFPHAKAMRMWDDVFERCYYGRHRGRDPR